jgi:hypothetical protein
LIHNQIYDGKVIRICTACQINPLLIVKANALEVDNPQVFSQNVVYGSVTKLAGVITLKKAIVIVYKNC